jgi:probable rRNA maturation factor
VPVQIINKQKTVKVSVRGLRELLEAVLAEELPGGGQVNVLLTDDGHIAELNEQFLGERGPTDVLAFGMAEAGAKEGAVVGDIAVSAETAAREGKRHGNTPEEELTRYAVHGLLHLAGYDDHEESDRRRMWKRQEQVMKIRDARKKKERVR